MGFDMTTILLNLHNAGFWGVGSMILAMAGSTEASPRSLRSKWSSRGEHVWDNRIYIVRRFLADAGFPAVGSGIGMVG
jgi:hypothetical protein